MEMVGLAGAHHPYTVARMVTGPLQGDDQVNAAATSRALHTQCGALSTPQAMRRGVCIRLRSPHVRWRLGCACFGCRSGIVLVALEQVGGGCRHATRSPQHSKGDGRRRRELALFCLWCYLLSWLPAHIYRWSRWLSAHRYRGVLLQIPSRQAFQSAPPGIHCPHGRDVRAEPKLPESGNTRARDV
ncbi:hypothetical protein P171DRAFT_189797 [Karstenula rhodostoma CBS 690.94]|uniref:Uncharacterized protein n=1 Tax=Karstenula rhodostoma CBS 690.94 TaxID=1392251 RepID=A0A9P4PRX0_9PLEO|nr:hypothetical protein P171DRAFT_189797 [Karstenula rhodostoma CBS 690.94]